MNKILKRSCPKTSKHKMSICTQIKMHYTQHTRHPAVKESFVFRYQNQGCESPSFELISSFLKMFLCQNFSFFFYFEPIFGIFTQFHAVFPCFLSVVSHTSAKVFDGFAFYIFIQRIPLWLKVLAMIPYFNFHFFPHLLIFLQFRDSSYVLNLSTKAVLQKWHI